MKLLCDHMLGTLAKWLRFMGYDTAYPEPGPDRELLEQTRAEGRTLLTRDKELAAREPDAVLVRSDRLDDQIREVVSALSLRLIDPLSRCSVCNEPLVSISPGDLKYLVPAGVRSRHRDFWRCPSCQRVYWQGSHWDKMIQRLESFRPSSE